jgi:C4-dicarboxylate-specific signal transduction histidine kinase
VTERVGSQRRLIVVDDEPVILDVLGAIFADEPYQVIRCGDGAAALQAFAAGVDVLLTDKNLPDVNGLELVRRARARQSDVEAIVITGYASLETAVQAMEVGVFDYIVKPPADIFEVRRKVARAFEKQALSRDKARLMEALRSQNTHLELTLEALRAAQAELVQAEKLAGIGTLAAGIAHEISSPLFGVMGLAEAIGDEDDREVVRGYAAEIVSYSRTIKDIVQGLTGYARTPEAMGGVCDLGQAAFEAIKVVRWSAGTESMHWKQEIEDNVRVWGRSIEVQQVFVNLVRNAVDALDECGSSKPVIGVKVAEQDGWACASVSDNGPGIEQDVQARIFDPFFTTKPPGQGTGLGLNIVYRILHGMRGSVRVESTLGQGTTFHLRFPLMP